MKKRQTLINLIANIISFSSSFLLSFVLTPFLIDHLGKEAYGFYPISNNFVGYMSILSAALNSMAARYISIEVYKKNLQEVKSYFSSVFLANILLSFILLVPMSLIVSSLGLWLNIPFGYALEVKYLFLFIFASMLTNVLFSVFGTATFAKNRTDIRSGIEIVLNIVKIGLYLLLFSAFRPRLVTIGIVTLCISVLSGLLQLWFSTKLLPGLKISFHYFQFAKVKELLISGIWNAFNSLGTILMLSVALVIANIYLGEVASGELAIVQVLPGFMNGVVTMLITVFLPRITQVYAQGSLKALVQEVKFSQRAIGLLATTPVISLLLFGYDFFQLWVPRENTHQLQILSATLLVPMLVQCNMWSIFCLNTTLNKVKFPALIFILAGLLNISLCHLILKTTKWGVYSIPAISSSILVVYYLFFIPIYAASQLNIRLNSYYPHIVKSFCSMIVILSVGFSVKRVFVIHTWVDFILWGGLFSIFSYVVNGLFVLEKNDRFYLLSFLNRFRKPIS